MIVYKFTSSGKSFSFSTNFKTKLIHSHKKKFRVLKEVLLKTVFTSLTATMVLTVITEHTVNTAYTVFTVCFKDKTDINQIHERF